MNESIIPEPLFFNEEWISDGIKDAYKNWHIKQRPQGVSLAFKSATRILIESATGTGKTSFIINKLLPFAAENNRNILYFGNRIALENQLINSLENNSSLIDITDSILDRSKEKPRIFKHQQSLSKITVTSYQSYINALTYKEYVLPDPYYVILDEAHFFLSDSLFNRKTHEILNTILETLHQKVLIFMSATPTEFRPVFNRIIPYLGAGHENFDLYKIFYKDEIEIYHNNYNPYFAYKFLCYHKHDDIIAKIKKTDKSEKWLIFVNSIKDGSDLFKQIKISTNRKVKFLSADNKKNVTWKRLITEHYFKEDILITTSVLDNGVNIVDADIRHIVLPFSVETDFIQMLGRRRMLNADDQVNVYIEQPSVQKINSLIYYTNHKLDIMNEYTQILEIKNYNKELYNKKIVAFTRKLWNKHDITVWNLFQLKKNNDIKINWLAHHRLLTLSDFYMGLRKKYSYPGYYLQNVLDWVHFDNNSIVSHLYCEQCNNLTEFIDYFKDKHIPAEDFESFYQCFQYYYKFECYDKFKDNPDEKKAALGIRKGSTQRKATMNRSLKMLQLPYVVKKEKETWIIRDLQAN